jgi:hypothetical protein
MIAPINNIARPGPLGVSVRMGCVSTNAASMFELEQLRALA